MHFMQLGMALGITQWAGALLMMFALQNLELSKTSIGWSTTNSNALQSP
jgi:hypothetical protein